MGLAHALATWWRSVCFATARALRGNRRPVGAARWLALAGFGVTGVTAWLGGELINRHGIGVHDLIGEDVPSSLSRHPRQKLELPRASTPVEL